MLEEPLTWHSWTILLRPDRIRARLDQVAQHIPVHRLPNLWQLELGVLRMWHRMLFRPDTIGCCGTHPVRSNWRARLLEFRPIRFFGLVASRAITPWDLTGLLSSRTQTIRHLLGAHHDGTQFVYDLQLLTLHEDGLETLHAQLENLLSGQAPRAEWLRDLVVYDQYHEDLMAGVQHFLAGAREINQTDSCDPDISLWAYLGWCSAQPSTPGAWWHAWRQGEFQWT